MKILVKAAIAAAVLAAPGTVAAQAEADAATGCLTRSGQITKVAIGDQPARPCRSRETQVSWRLGGDDEEEGGSERVDFFLAMERDGPDETIATNGPLEVFARCYTEPFFGTTHQFEIKVTSDVVGWWVKGRNTPLGADEDEQVFSVTTAISDYHGPVYFDGYEQRGTHSALAPDGSYVAIEPDTLSVGVNILGHDCIAIGTVILKQVDLQ